MCVTSGHQVGTFEQIDSQAASWFRGVRVRWTLFCFVQSERFVIRRKKDDQNIVKEE